MTSRIDGFVERGEIGGRTVQIVDTGAVECAVYPAGAARRRPRARPNGVLRDQPGDGDDVLRQVRAQRLPAQDAGTRSCACSSPARPR